MTSTYGYDDIYQLQEVTQGVTTTESYTYDPVGNRLSSLGLSPYVYNESNQLNSTPSTSYSYDFNGNTLTKTEAAGVTNYAWDYENRLTSVTLGGGGIVTFKYDLFGRRIYKSSSAGTSVFAYDGHNLIEETNAAVAVVARYEQTQNIDEPLAMLRSAATSYYHADGIGSVTSLTSAAGAVVQTYTFDSFGKQTASSGSLTNPFQYTGRELDSETGLYFYRARYYDLQTGRFTSEDLLRFGGGYDFYAYVANKPTEFSDPMGLLPTTDHLNLTLDLARAAFGPKCLSRARAVAQANADQDASPGFAAKLKFLVGAGDGWKKGSIHFGGPVDQTLDNAFTNCDDYSLGKGLHGLQDDLAHSGGYSNPSVHYWTSVLSFVTGGIGGFNPADHPGFQGLNDISGATATILLQYKAKCLGCCQ